MFKRQEPEHDEIETKVEKHHAQKGRRAGKVEKDQTFGLGHRASGGPAPRAPRDIFERMKEGGFCGERQGARRARVLADREPQGRARRAVEGWYLQMD